MGKQKKQTSPSTIAVNRKALHDYTIEQQLEAGLVLEGWEVKSLRAGRAQLKDSYVTLHGDEAFLIGAHFSPLTEACTYLKPDPTRSRKLLLHKKEIHSLRRAKEREGYTIVALNLHWKSKRAKVQIGIAKGRKLHDKRQVSKEREWNREKARLLKPR